MRAKLSYLFYISGPFSICHHHRTSNGQYLLFDACLASLDLDVGVHRRRRRQDVARAGVLFGPNTNEVHTVKAQKYLLCVCHDDFTIMKTYRAEENFKIKLKELIGTPHGGHL